MLLYICLRMCSIHRTARPWNFAIFIRTALEFTEQESAVRLNIVAGARQTQRRPYSSAGVAARGGVVKGPAEAAVAVRVGYSILSAVKIIGRREG